jgi:hypothetical protein
VPMLDTAIERAGAGGTRQVVIGMAHRGRINVLAHILDKPYASIFAGVRGEARNASNAESGTGDVKYHLGAGTERTLATATRWTSRCSRTRATSSSSTRCWRGYARALQRVAARRLARATSVRCFRSRARRRGLPGRGRGRGDAQPRGLRGLPDGRHAAHHRQQPGRLHHRSADGRSTYYASDLAKGFDIPIVHVNADDAEACALAVLLAIAYRTRVRQGFPDRSRGLPPSRSQRDRRAGVHAATAVQRDPQASDGARGLGSAAGGGRSAHREM